MKAFQMAAARQAETEEKGEDQTLEFSIGEYKFRGLRPTPAQVSLLVGTGGLGGAASLGATYRFLRGVLDQPSYNLFLTLIEDRKLTDDMLYGANAENDEGIIDWLIEQVAERPTQPPTGSSTSSESGGKKSTGRSPGKGSTLSD